jgi:hypothetical protein
MIVVYPVGVPLLYLAALRPYMNNEVNDAQLRKSSYAKSRHLAFFYADYRPQVWWWEIVVLVKKLLLTGFVFYGGMCARSVGAGIVLLICSNILSL